MELVKGSGKAETLQLKNANGKSIDIISFTVDKKVFCVYRDEVERLINKGYHGKIEQPPRIFFKKDLEFYASLRSYNDKIYMAINTNYAPMFFVNKEDILKSDFNFDYLKAE